MDCNEGKTLPAEDGIVIDVELKDGVEARTHTESAATFGKMIVTQGLKRLE